MPRLRLLSRWLMGIVVTFAMLAAPPGAAADTVGDYRSKATGNWGDATTWQVFNGTKWVDASVPPTSASGVITVRNGYTVTIAADVSVDQLVVEAGGTLIIGSTSTMTLTNGTGTDLTVAGTLLNQGTFSRAAYATWAVAAGGVYIHNTRAAVSDLLGSAVSLDAQSTFIYRGSSTLNPPVSLSDQTYGHLTFESTAGSWTPTLSGNKTLTVKGTFTIGKDVTFNAITGRFTGPITLQGNWTNDGTFNSDSATGAVTLSGINPQTIGGTSPTTFNSLTISNTKSSGVTLAQDIAINGTLTIVAGATFSADTYTITAGGDWVNNGTFSAGKSKVIFNRAGTSLISGADATTFYDLEIGPNTALDVEKYPLFDALNSVRNYGRLRQTRAIGTDNVAFLNLSSGTYRGVEVDPSGSTAMGSVTVTIYGEQNCPSPPVLGVAAIKRCFDIAATTPVAAKVRFWYDAANELNGNTPGKELVYYQDNDRWHEAQGTYAYSSGTFNSVAVTDISTFSRFALTSNAPDPANLIVLARFAAAATASGIELLWETLSEIDTVGFHLWRSEQPAAGYVRITPALIPARGSPTRGALYTYTDTAAPAGRPCYYRLEEIDVHGASAFYGPAGPAVVPAQGAGSRVYLPLVR